MGPKLILNIYTFNCVLQLYSRNQSLFFFSPQRLKEVKLVPWKVIGPKHGMHMLHLFQQEKYWPAEHEIKDKELLLTQLLWD